MAGGYMGRNLWVDLSTGRIEEEPLEEKLARDFIGGYGIAARIAYSRQKPGVDPLGPENILGLTTGPLTGTVPFGSRFTVTVGRSPLTDGWGDANSGGDWGPGLKFAGYDNIFFTGVSEKPVYLLIKEGSKPELRDASNLWGKDVCETEMLLEKEHGDGTCAACIGPSGENLSLISCVITKRGAAAGRSGVGAVMGSKKLKAVAVIGHQKVPVAHSSALARVRKEHVEALRASPQQGGESVFARFHKYGTSSGTARSAHSGDTPVKNWGGVGIIDFPDVAGLSGDAVIANVEKSEGCWSCPMRCQALLKAGTGEYKYAAGARRPEYETLASFGTMCLNSNAESIAMCNDICSRYGLDTISAGCAISFAIECYENGLINKSDTDGIELTWGNHRAIVAMTEKLARREGLGDILADGVKVAAEKIGKGAEKYAVHIGGQELGMHDPKLVGYRTDTTPASRYQMDATPGRHTQGFGPSGFRSHVINASGLCMFGFFFSADSAKYIAGYMQAVTGLERSMDDLLKAGDRIATIRHAINLREGINPLKLPVHARIAGNPPQTEGPLKGVTMDFEAQAIWNLGALDWDRVTSKPSKKKLLELGLDDVAKDLWP